MTAALTSTPYAPADAVWQLLPPVAPYDRIAPTSVNGSRRQHVRPIQVTSSFIDAAATLALSAAVGWLAAALRPPGAGMGGMGVAVAATGMLAWPTHADPACGTGGFLDVLRRTVADEVRGLRDEIQRSGGLSRSDIAQLVGVDRRSLSGWVSGKTSPSTINLNRLRTLAEVVRRLNHLGVPELAVSMRDAETAGVVTDAVRGGRADRAVDAALGSVVEETSEALVPALTPEQWNALHRLAITAEAAEIESGEVAGDEPEPPPRPLRVQLERAAYATPRRPRRAMRGE